MRKTLQGMAGAAALSFALSAGAEGLRDERRPIASSTVHRDAPDKSVAYGVEQRSGDGTEEMKPCGESETAGSASGEPSKKKTGPSASPDRRASQEEFLRNVWSTP